MNYYILNEQKQPVKVPAGSGGLLLWSEFIESSSAVVAVENISAKIYVSTTFLGIGDIFGNPVNLFETMVFGGKNDMYQDRYNTWEEAVQGHAMAVKMVRRDEYNLWEFIKSVFGYGKKTGAGKSGYTQSIS